MTHIWGMFDLVELKVILESFDALFSKCLVNRKRLAIEQTRTEL